MQVNVFLAREQRGPRSKLLVLTVASEAEIPKNLSKYWRFYGTIDSQSALFDGIAVELHLQARGFAIVEA